LCPVARRCVPRLHDRLAAADVVLFDATLFTDDEMIRTGTGTKTGRRMGHMPIDGPRRYACRAVGSAGAAYF